MPDLPNALPLTALSEALPREETGTPPPFLPHLGSAWVGCEDCDSCPSFSLKVRGPSHFNMAPQRSSLTDAPL
jgi:hypothetical protein